MEGNDGGEVEEYGVVDGDPSVEGTAEDGEMLR